MVLRLSQRGRKRKGDIEVPPAGPRRADRPEGAPSGREKTDRFRCEGLAVRVHDRLGVVIGKGIIEPRLVRSLTVVHLPGGCCDLLFTNQAVIAKFLGYHE